MITVEEEEDWTTIVRKRKKNHSKKEVEKKIEKESENNSRKNMEKQAKPIGSLKEPSSQPRHQLHDSFHTAQLHDMYPYYELVPQTDCSVYVHTKPVKSANAAEESDLHHLRCCTGNADGATGGHHTLSALDSSIRHEPLPQIFVKTLTGRTITVGARASWTICRIKIQIFEKLGIPTFQQHLTFVGKQLQDDQMISDYNIKEFSTIDLSLRLVGGMTRGDKQRMKLNFRKFDVEHSGLVSEDGLCKLILSDGNSLDKRHLKPLLDPHRCKTNPNLIQYNAFLDSLWPDEQEADNTENAVNAFVDDLRADYQEVDNTENAESGALPPCWARRNVAAPSETDEPKKEEGASAEAEKEETKLGDGNEESKSSEAKKEEAASAEAKESEKKPGEGGKEESNSSDAKKEEGTSAEAEKEEKKPGDGNEESQSSELKKEEAASAEAREGEKKPGEGGKEESNSSEAKKKEGTSAEADVGEKKSEEEAKEESKSSEAKKEEGTSAEAEKEEKKLGDGNEESKSSKAKKEEATSAEAKEGEKKPEEGGKEESNSSEEKKEEGTSAEAEKEEKKLGDGNEESKSSKAKKEEATSAEAEEGEKKLGKASPLPMDVPSSLPPVPGYPPPSHPPAPASSLPPSLFPPAASALPIPSSLLTLLSPLPPPPSSTSHPLPEKENDGLPENSEILTDGLTPPPSSTFHALCSTFQIFHPLLRRENEGLAENSEILTDGLPPPPSSTSHLLHKKRNAGLAENSEILTDVDIAEILAKMKTMDEDGNGFVEMNQMEQVFKDSPIHFDTKFADFTFFSHVKSTGSIFVRYSQLIAALMNAGLGNGKDSHVRLSTKSLTRMTSRADVAMIADDAIDAYDEVKRKMGSEEGIARYKERSEALQAEVKRRLTKKMAWKSGGLASKRVGEKDAWRQDVIIRHLGLDGLIEVGRSSIKPLFDTLVTRLAEQFGATAIIPSVKAPRRSHVNVAVRYGDDASQLSDIVRATLQFKMHAAVLEDMYNAIEAIIYMPELISSRAIVTHFDDRYQKPLPGGYRHLLCLIKIHGYVCELLFNVDDMVEIHEGPGGIENELTQKVNDELLYASMKCRFVIPFLDVMDRSVMGVLEDKANPNARCDMHGLTPLHYAAHHGNADMVKALLRHNANVLDGVFAQDNGGQLPIQKAVLLGHEDVTRVLLDAMEEVARGLRSLPHKLTGDLAAAALEKMQDGKSLHVGLIRRLVSFEAKWISKKSSIGETNLVHCWAIRDRSEAFLTAKKMELQEIVGGTDKNLLDFCLRHEKDEHGSTALDCAIDANSSGIAEELLKAGCRPTRPYITNQRSPKLLEILNKHCPSNSQGVQTIHSNGRAFAAIKADGSVVAWGWAVSGGDCTNIKEQLTSDVQSLHSTQNAFAALKTDGSVIAWGWPHQGGDITAVQDQLANDVQYIHSTTEAFAALKADGRVVTWGQHGEVQQQFPSNVCHILSNAGAFAALTTDGGVVAWGCDIDGGDCSKVQDQLRTNVQSMFATERAFAVLKADGIVVAWGSEHCGGDYSKVQSQLNGNVQSIVCTSGAFAALKADGSVVAWGDKDCLMDCRTQDQLNSNVQSIYVTDRAFAALRADGSAVAWGNKGWGGDCSNVEEELRSNVQHIYATERAFAVLKSHGNVVTWGAKHWGGDCSDVQNQLNSNVQSILVTAQAFAAKKADGSVIAWGDGHYQAHRKASAKTQRLSLGRSHKTHSLEIAPSPAGPSKAQQSPAKTTKATEGPTKPSKARQSPAQEFGMDQGKKLEVALEEEQDPKEENKQMLKKIMPMQKEAAEEKDDEKQMFKKKKKTMMGIQKKATKDLKQILKEEGDEKQMLKKMMAMQEEAAEDVKRLLKEEGDEKQTLKKLMAMQEEVDEDVKQILEEEKEEKQMLEKMMTMQEEADEDVKQMLKKMMSMMVTKDDLAQFKKEVKKEEKEVVESSSFSSSSSSDDDDDDEENEEKKKKKKKKKASLGVPKPSEGIPKASQDVPKSSQGVPNAQTKEEQEEEEEKKKKKEKKGTKLVEEGEANKLGVDIDLQARMRAIDENSNGFVRILQMEEIFKDFAMHFGTHFCDSAFFSFVKSTGACVVKYRTLIAGLFDFHSRFFEEIEVKCPGDHYLSLFETPAIGHAFHWCDHCGETFPTGTSMYGCRECDYDLCLSCFDILQDLKGGAPTPAELLLQNAQKALGAIKDECNIDAEAPNVGSGLNAVRNKRRYSDSDGEVSTFDSPGEVSTTYDSPGEVSTTHDSPDEVPTTHDSPGEVDMLKLAKEAEAMYAQLETKLGGHVGIKMYEQRSQELQLEVKRRVAEKTAWRQDDIVHHVGLNGLIEVGESSIKPLFDKLVTQLAKQFRAKAIIPSVKGPGRSHVKVGVRYGHVSRLTDIVRATLQFKMHDEVLEEMYSAVESIIYMPQLISSRAIVTHFDDRYQQPLPGGYRDLLCLIKIHGHACELQLNVDDMLKIQEDTKHQQYELSTKVNEELIYSAMKGRLASNFPDMSRSVMAALQAKADPNAINSRDGHGLTALHYASHHGDTAMVKALLRQNANAFAQDNTGQLPIQRAVLLGHEDVIFLLLEAMDSAFQEAMEGATMYSLPIEPTGDLAATALEKTQDGESLPASLIYRVVSWEAKWISKTSSLVHCWAIQDRSEAFLTARQMKLQDIVGSPDRKDENGSTALDCAIHANSSGIAEELLKAGYRPTKPYITDLRSPKLLQILDKHRLAAGDVVTVVKEGTQIWQRAEVVEPDWNGMVKVRMLSGPDKGKTKSYKSSDLRSSLE